MSQAGAIRPPVPPFTFETAREKVRLAEDGWNSRDAAKVAPAYSLDRKWRNRAAQRSGTLNGRGAPLLHGVSPDTVHVRLSIAYFGE
jgi:nuclear transport factor 2 (NTF2) superfamily protein